MALIKKIKKYCFGLIHIQLSRKEIIFFEENLYLTLDERSLHSTGKEARGHQQPLENLIRRNSTISYPKNFKLADV